MKYRETFLRLILIYIFDGWRHKITFFDGWRMRGHRGFLLEVPSHAGMFSSRAANPT